MARRARSETFGLAQIALAATIWGSIPVLVREVDASPLVIVFWRVFFAGLVIGGYLLFRGRLAEVKALPRRRVIALVGMGALLTLNWVLFFGALTLTDVSVAVLLAYCGPVFVAALTPLLAHLPFDRRVIVPLALALLGVIIIVGPNRISLDSPSSLLGAGMAFTSAITYALLVLNAQRLVRGIPATVYMLVEYTTASLLLLPAVLFLPGPSGVRQWGALVVLGVISTAITGFLFLSAIRTVRADHAAIITYAEPVSAVAFAAAFLAEPITVATIAGGALIITGGLLVVRMRTGVTVEGPPVMVREDVGNTALKREE